MEGNNKEIWSIFVAIEHMIQFTQLLLLLLLLQLLDSFLNLSARRYCFS